MKIKDIVTETVKQSDPLKVLYNIANRKDKKSFPVRIGDIITDIHPGTARRIVASYLDGSDGRKSHIRELLKTHQGLKQLISTVESIEIDDDYIFEVIRKLANGKFRLYSKSGKNLGTYDSRKGAEERERQVNYFKHMGERIEEAWSAKYKSSINCDNPKGFSQKAHCAGRKKSEDIEENFADGKKFVEPNFSSEWEEAARYPEFVKIGKEAWIKLAKKGKAVTITSAKDINNTDAADPDSFKSLDSNKQKRALAQLEKGEVEMPIVAVYSDGYKELIGGNTRLTAMMAKDGKATVWAFNIPDEIALLAEADEVAILADATDPILTFIQDKEKTHELSYGNCGVLAIALDQKFDMDEFVYVTNDAEPDKLYHVAAVKGGKIYDADGITNLANVRARGLDDEYPDEDPEVEHVPAVESEYRYILQGTDPDISVEDLNESSSKDNYGIPDGATLAQLDKIAKTATNPEKRERAHWLRNMRRGKNK